MAQSRLRVSGRRSAEERSARARENRRGKEGERKKKRKTTTSQKGLSKGGGREAHAGMLAGGEGVGGEGEEVGRMDGRKEGGRRKEKEKKKKKGKKEK